MDAVVEEQSFVNAAYTRLALFTDHVRERMDEISRARPRIIDAVADHALERRAEPVARTHLALETEGVGAELASREATRPEVHLGEEARLPRSDHESPELELVPQHRAVQILRPVVGAG